MGVKGLKGLHGGKDSLRHIVAGLRQSYQCSGHIERLRSKSFSVYLFSKFHVYGINSPSYGSNPIRPQRLVVTLSK